MNIIAHIIETDTIEVGDMIAFEFKDVEVAGIVSEINEDGTFKTSTVAFGKIDVDHDKITDIA